MRHKFLVLGLKQQQRTVVVGGSIPLLFNEVEEELWTETTSNMLLFGDLVAQIKSQFKVTDWTDTRGIRT